MNLSMSVNKDGKMTNCPLTNEHSSLCQMPATDHLSKWLQMFTALPALSYFLISVALIVISFKFFLPEFALTPPAFNFRRYKFNYPDKLFDNLLLAFSDGILHPKIP